MELSRRGFVIGAVATPLAAAVLPRAAWAAGQPLQFFDDHQSKVVVEATARLIPGPEDDPLELCHAGAREAGVVHYIDALLSAFDTDPPRIYAGGPFSGRHGGGPTDDFARYVPLSPIQERFWRAEVTRLQGVYRKGIVALDKAANGDFAHAPAVLQDVALTSDQTGFRDVLFDHAIEGWLANPEYGGNDDLAGWLEIGFDGDVCPEGYTPGEVSKSDGLDVIDPTGIISKLLGHLRVVLDG